MDIEESWILRSQRGRAVLSLPSLARAFEEQDRLAARGVTVSVHRRVIMEQDIGRVAPSEVPAIKKLCGLK